LNGLMIAVMSFMYPSLWFPDLSACRSVKKRAEKVAPFMQLRCHANNDAGLRDFDRKRALPLPNG